MGHHNRSSFGRTLAIAIAALSVASAAHGQPAGSDAPAVKPQNAAPADQGGKPAAGPSPIIQKGPTRADCEKMAKVLAGKEKDADLLEQAGKPSAATRNTNNDLVTCTAVLADSDEPCARLDKENADNCRRDRAVFHELRANPNGKGFMFDERKFDECKQNAVMAPMCESLRAALRSGDPAQCVLKGDWEAICRGAGDIDPAKCPTEAPQLKALMEGQCRAMVTLDEAACDSTGPRHEEMAKQCREDIKAAKAYGKNLKDLAASGSPREQELAKAALKDPAACKAFTDSAIEACVKGDETAAPGAVDPAPPTPGPADPEAQQGR